MFVLKSVRRGAVVALLACGLAACSESVTSPVGISPDAGPLMSSGSSGNSGRGQGEGSRTFTVWPGYPVIQRFGDHLISIPANVVCDPAASSYGAAFWDAPCSPATQPIQVTATWSVRDDKPIISFTPDLRFAPSDDPSQWVNLTLKASRGIDPSMYYAILWFDKDAGQWVDESQSDPTLRARTSDSGNMVVRRLKHFSDYFLWFGFGSYNVTSGIGLGGDELWGAW